MSKKSLESKQSDLTEFSSSISRIQIIQSYLHRYPWLSSASVLIMAIFSFSFFNSNFLTPGNLSLILQQVSIIGALALGQTIIILTGGIDLSCAAISVCCMMIMAKSGMGDPYIENDGLSIWLAFPLGIFIAALAGAFNGFLVTKFRLPPFIVTLGTLNIFIAITILYASGRSILENEIDPFLLELSNILKIGEFVVTYGVILMLLMYVFFAYSLRFTSWGRHIYAVGNDPEAARLSGISVNKVLMSAYLVAGLIFGLTSWIMIGRIMVASPNVPSDYNLVAITAVVIGGTSLFGGRGTVFGTLIGACIVGVFQNGLTLAGVDLTFQVLAIGILIIFAVTLDTWVRRVKV